MSDSFSAIVLAGGKSERMGRAKADLPFGSETMLARIVRVLAREFPDIVVVAAPAALGSPDAIAPARIIHDPSAYAGPVDALARGLRAALNPVAFACSCDLPLLDAPLAVKICAMLGRNDDAVVPRVDGRYQPLHAAWHTRCAGLLAHMHASGERRLSGVMTKLHTRIVEEREIHDLSSSLDSFINVNTPEDYERALSAAGLKPAR